jgi:hypothetical protein
VNGDCRKIAFGDKLSHLNICYFHNFLKLQKNSGAFLSVQPSYLSIDLDFMFGNTWFSNLHLEMCIYWNARDQ